MKTIKIIVLLVLSTILLSCEKDETFIKDQEIIKEDSSIYSDETKDTEVLKTSFVIKRIENSNECYYYNENQTESIEIKDATIYTSFEDAEIEIATISESSILYYKIESIYITQVTEQ